MKPVIQLERTGNGIAGVAALAGVSYTAAKHVANRLGIYAADKRLWSETAHVRRLLKQYRLHASIRTTPFVSWNTLPDRALLAIKWHRVKGQAFCHWVVFIRDTSGSYVLDSKRSLQRHVRTDFGRMKPRWFIEIQYEASCR
ncbi:MAG: hypothetical protein OJF51_004766 [Nitrospira sp.]|jgi:hypothetical protein|nr:MAG: hypothetical protein OJF51_004766 [Nitrospira sp.]